MWSTWLALAGASYLLGSIPFALLVGKFWAGIDIRRGGSGNTGATNLFRLAGWGPGLLGFLLDFGKGWVPALVASGLGGPTAGLLMGLAAVAGHNWSVYLKGRGGKGAATSLGVLFAVAPLGALVAAVLFVAVVLATRYVSLGSMMAALSAPLTLWLLGAGRAEVIIAAVLTVMLVLRHRPNIARLLAGTENRLVY